MSNVSFDDLKSSALSNVIGDRREVVEIEQVRCFVIALSIIDMVCSCKMLLQLVHISFLMERKIVLSIGLSVSLSMIPQLEHLDL
jgi:hypothetical protein